MGSPSWGVSVEDDELAAQFTQGELRKHQAQFDALRTGSSPVLSPQDIKSGARKLGFSEELTDGDVKTILEDNDPKNSGSLSFEGFLRLQLELDRPNTRYSPRLAARGSPAKRDFVRAASSASRHTIDESEKIAYVDHINSELADDPTIGRHLPIDPATDALIRLVQEGVLLCTLINVAVPGTIDVRALNVKETLNPWERIENHRLCLDSAKAIGCTLVNIGSQDLLDGREHLILGLVAQIIKVQLLSKVNLSATPELLGLADDSQELEALLNASSEEVLLRWINYHLKAAGSSRKVNNFSLDLKDGEVYCRLLHQLAPKDCSLAPLDMPPGPERAAQVLAQAEAIGCRRYLQPKDIMTGSPNLNLAFVANLFRTRNGLDVNPALLQRQHSLIEQAALPEDETSPQGAEERAFTAWLNSTGISIHVRHLFFDLRDGFVLLEVLDKLKSGCVDWRHVSRPPVSTPFRKLENCNRAIEIGRTLQFSLVSVAGGDIVAGNHKLILALLWQMMRFHLLTLLQELRAEGGANKEVTDGDIVEWANGKVREAGKSSSMESFRDKSLTSGIFLLDLLEAVKPGVVNWNLVTKGGTDEEKQQNAQYIISVARKIGCSIFLIPDDVMQVRPKMILTLLASIMYTAQSNQGPASGTPQTPQVTPKGPHHRGWQALANGLTTPGSTGSPARRNESLRKSLSSWQSSRSSSSPLSPYASDGNSTPESRPPRS